MQRSVKIKVPLKGRSAVWLHRSVLLLQYKGLKREWDELQVHWNKKYSFFLFWENHYDESHEIQAVMHAALNWICFTSVLKTVAALKVDIPKI